MTAHPSFLTRREAATLIDAPSLTLSAHAQSAGSAAEKTADCIKPGQSTEDTTKLLVHTGFALAWRRFFFKAVPKPDGIRR